MMTCWSWTRSPLDRGKIVRELAAQGHPLVLERPRRQRDHLARGIVQVHPFGRSLLVGEERAQALDHLGGAVSVPDEPGGNLARALDLGQVRGQSSHAGVGVRDHAGERLVELVGDAADRCPMLATRLASARRIRIS